MMELVKYPEEWGAILKSNEPTQLLSKMSDDDLYGYQLKTA